MLVAVMLGWSSKRLWGLLLQCWDCAWLKEESFWLPPHNQHHMVWTATRKNGSPYLSQSGVFYCPVIVIYIIQSNWCTQLLLKIVAIKELMN